MFERRLDGAAVFKRRLDELDAKHRYRRPPLPDGVDPFQNLPGELWAKIASFLPIEYAAETSVLSKEWRDKWKVMSTNRHFTGPAEIKFSRSGCPVSQFCCLDEFLSWIEEHIIVQIVESGDEDLLVKSLGINFLHGDYEYGWIELSKDDVPGVAGYRVVSFKNPNRCRHGRRRLRIGDVFSSPPWRAYLLRHLTLQHCGMETVNKHLIGGGGGGGEGYNCLRWLKSLTLRFVTSVDEKSLSDLISCCPSLEKLEFFCCDFVAPQLEEGGMIVIEIRLENLKKLDLICCSGAHGLRVFAGRRYGGSHPFKVPLMPVVIQTTFFYEPRKRRFLCRVPTDGRINYCELPDAHWPTGSATPYGQPMPAPPGTEETAKEEELAHQ